ncbi:MAG: type I DNA topoisomerase [Chloroflexota bacterium]|nr:type I DNA topoisomerase [Chloroflexota bacterium]
MTEEMTAGRGIEALTEAPIQTKKKPARKAGAKKAPGRAKSEAASKARSSGSSGKHLVIVESPAKARTLSGILGRQYEVRASVGHVRDLPKSQLGVNVDGDFEPKYIIPKDKKELVKGLKEAARHADRVYLATDPDREGEAISWHLLEAMELPEGSYQRVEFHEITTDAVLAAFDHPREINMRLVDAQQGRRVLDRLVGYKISPILWQKIRGGLSAGRVQSVALKMVVDREREILAFAPQEYWTIDTRLAKQAGGDDDAFTARLAGLPGTKKAEINSREHAEAVTADLRRASYAVRDVKKKQQNRRPAPPFTTSTLQQEASRRFGFSAKRTMAVAQQLYEGLTIPGQGQVGLITYMRTDSLNIADVARNEARDLIAQKYGREFVPEKPRFYKAKSKGAQEAHEAIRPTSSFGEPPMLRASLKPDQLKLYGLIWQRLMASQMADAVFDQVSVEIDGVVGAQPPYLLRASASHMRFAGFRQVYIEGRDTDADEDAEKSLPELSERDLLRLLQVQPDQHFTEPPPRFTEATLVKALEENGIGRPSTYAAIMSTIQDRGYVKKDGRALKPEDLGLVVSDMLTEQFPGIVDTGFTARMEDELDDVASGDRAWPPVVREFYEPLEVALAAAADAPRVEEQTNEVCDKCGKPMILRWGRFGQFLACSAYPECKSTRPVGEEAAAQAQQTDEKCDICESPMVIKRGRFGQFLACSKYPECKGARPILKKVGVLCPKDAGEMVEKKTKRGRIFYSCANYPKCDFSSWSRPLKQSCPVCKSLTVVGAKGTAKCTACDWKGDIDELTEPELARASA